jgi:hypothetical protein
MPVELTTHAVEESTYTVTVSFTDDAGVAVTPNAGLTWKLTDGLANVINSRSAVSITPGTSVTIVLTGDDLALTGTLGRERYITIEGTYNSDAGTNLKLKEQIKFIVDDLIAVS